jgi:hypothetical protein
LIWWGRPATKGLGTQDRDVLFSLDKRAHTFLLLLLSLPFVQPIPLPGLSTPFGVAIAFLGISFLFGQKPCLPKRLLKMQLPEIFLAPALQGMRRLAGDVRPTPRCTGTIMPETPSPMITTRKVRVQARPVPHRRWRKRSHGANTILSASRPMTTMTSMTPITWSMAFNSRP